MRAKTAFASFLLLLSLHLFAQQTRTASDYYELAMQAYKAKDYASYVLNLQKVLEAGTTHPRVFYNLASGYALLHNKNEAIKWLTKIADLEISFPVQEDPDFASIRESPEFHNILARFASNERPLIRSKIAFTIPDSHFVPEGITYEPKRKTFYLGSILEHKILEIDSHGQSTEISSPQDGLWAVLGMSIDHARNTLWVSSSALAESESTSEKTVSAIFKYDLQKKKLRKKYDLPADQSHQLGDVIVSSTGDAFATDSNNPAIYRIDHENDRIEQLPVGDLFRSPQGLCFSSDQRSLFVADYVRGIFVIDVNTKQSRKLTATPEATLAGIDGLYCYRDSLIATQNGFTPNRILRIALNKQQTRCSESGCPGSQPSCSGGNHAGNNRWE